MSTSYTLWQTQNHGHCHKHEHALALALPNTVEAHCITLAAVKTAPLLAVVC